MHAYGYGSVAGPRLLPMATVDANNLLCCTQFGVSQFGITSSCITKSKKPC